MRAFERQPKESLKAFEAFKAYRDLGPSRSLAKASEAYYGDTRNLAQTGVWSRRFSWVERVQAFDDWQEMIRNDAIEEHERSKATEYAERQSALREQRLAYAEKIAGQIGEMVSWPLAKEETTEDGKTTIIRPVRWSKTTIAHLDAVVGATLESSEEGEGVTPEFEQLVKMLKNEQ